MTRITPEDGIAIVTGAGSGLGRALARQLCDAGFTVVGVRKRYYRPSMADAHTMRRERVVRQDVADR